MTTLNEERRFGYHKKTGIDLKSKPKPDRGDLLLILGSKEIVLYHDQPFGFLNYIKSDMIRNNKAERHQLKITYTKNR